MTNDFSAFLKHCKWFYGAAAMLAICIYCTNAFAADISFPLHTSGPYIVDANNHRVRLKAANWYGAESADYVVGGLQTATLSSIVQKMKNLGFNAVRLPWSNELYEKNPVVSNAALAANPALQGKRALTILDQVIAELSRAGMMVILDNHNSNAEWCCNDKDNNQLWYNGDYPESSWIRDWKSIAVRYKNNPWVIGADLRNEPRTTATWGGSASTDWEAAAVRGGNAVLSVDSKLLIFVEGVNYALDLSGVSRLPVHLKIAHRLVYEAHDYGYDYSHLSGYSDYTSRITPRWGYLVTGSNPQPVWVGEFGTCNTADGCIASSKSGDDGCWFGFLTTYIQQYKLDWAYWSINGTQSTGSGRHFGQAETYGVLNAAWNNSASPELTSRLSELMTDK